MKIVADKKVHQLIIEDVTLGEIGEYSCVAGDVSTSAKLTVEGEGIVLIYFHHRRIIKQNILTKILAFSFYIQIIIFLSLISVNSIFP